MLNAQRGFAPDAAEIHVDADLALGRCLHRLFPEDRFDHGPQRFGGDRFALVADVRLDDRVQLARTLGIDSSCLREMADAALLAVAWERWGEETPGRLIGDFAVIVWDRELRTVTLARDPLGQKPLFYHNRQGMIAVASMPMGLHALADVPRRPDVDRVAQFLALMPEHGPQSFFEGVSRVEPGQVVTVDPSGDPSGVRTRRYWPGPIAPIRYARDADYAEALRERFDAAVGARLRAAGGNVAAQLSGGLDSSTVTATAARLIGEGGRVHAFTAVPRAGYDGPVPPGRFGDEWSMAASTAALYPNIRHRAVPNGGSPLAELERAAAQNERPFPNLANVRWWHRINTGAREAGATVLLTGAMGNLSISYGGWEALPEMLGGGRLTELMRLARALAPGGSSPRSLAARALGPLVPRSVWRARAGAKPQASFHEVTGLRRHIDPRHPRFGDAGTNLAVQPPRNAVAARLWGFGWADPGPFNKGDLAGWGLDLRDPTADRRVVEFCLAIPTEQFILNGVPRSLARRAFADRLPRQVAEETRIGLQSADWFEALTGARGELAAELGRIAEVAQAAELIDVPRLRRLVDEWPGQGCDGEATTVAYQSTLLRAISAGQFIRSAGGV